jgi:LCP family protein required for cell wall assembly
VRTTTKRGLGRAATLNGNGHAVLPPIALEPMRRYRQPPPPPGSPRKTAAKIFGWLLLAILVIVSGLAGGLYLYTHETLNSIAAHTQQAKATAKDKNVQEVASPTQPATALIIGYDTRKGVDAALGQDSRSDTLMLVRADPTENTMSIMSFPRDLTVPVYCNGSDIPRTHDRINVAWTLCGEQGTLDTVAKLTNIPINYVITVNFHGFKLIVNKLHGVFSTVDRRYYIPPNSGTAAINLNPGYQKLDGQEALDFVRYRHTDSDLYRNARQQLFLDSLKDRLASSFHLTEIPGLVGAVKGSVEVAQAGGGAPALNVIESYVGLGYRLPAGHLFRTQIPNLLECGYLNAEICASDTDIQSAAQKFMHPDVTVSKRANCQVIVCKKKPVTAPKALDPAAVSTLVLNGTAIPRLAGDTSYKLAMAGFHTVHLPESVTANAPRADYVSSYVYYDPVQANAKAAAAVVQKALGANVVVAALPQEIAPYAAQAGNPLTVLVVGSSFNGQLATAADQQQELPPKAAPQVSTFDPTGTYSAAGVRVPFKAMLPHVVAAGSTWTTMVPVRAFKPIAHHKELVLTFTNGTYYWNVIETNWNEAPILRRPTGKYLDRKTGRRFDVFTTSGNIHMIVYRAHGASYWVVNTLRDELSNETMLAIARGLQPVSQ